MRGGQVMKKWIILLGFVFVLAACNASNGGEAIDKQGDSVTVDETEVANEEEVNKETNESENGQVDSQEVNNEETKKETTKQKTNKSSVANGKLEKPKVDNHQEVVDLAYDIFEAQQQKDYAFLESVVTKGTKIDKENNQFIFEDAASPFEMEFFTKEDLGKLEFRYTHEEDGMVYVGFGAIHPGDSEATSFVIDFTFVKENGEWKMQSMDVNK